MEGDWEEANVKGGVEAGDLEVAITQNRSENDTEGNRVQEYVGGEH